MRRRVVIPKRSRAVHPPKPRNLELEEDDDKSPSGYPDDKAEQGSARFHPDKGGKDILSAREPE